MHSLVHFLERKQSICTIYISKREVVNRRRSKSSKTIWLINHFIYIICCTLRWILGPKSRNYENLPLSAKSLINLPLKGHQPSNHYAKITKVLIDNTLILILRKVSRVTLIPQNFINFWVIKLKFVKRYYLNIILIIFRIWPTIQPAIQVFSTLILRIRIYLVNLFFIKLFLVTFLDLVRRYNKFANISCHSKINLTNKVNCPPNQDIRVS